MHLRIFLMLLLGGCNSGSKSFADQAGRHCTATGLNATCDAVPQPSQACSTPYANACWSIFSNFPDAGPTLVENCASCCESDGGGNAVTKDQDCTPIVCKSVDDCPLSATGCAAGVCVTN